MYKKIDVDAIIPGENNRSDYVGVADLMKSIKNEGLLQPVGVRELGGNKYKLLYGFCRFYAVRKLGWDKIDCKVFKKDDEFETDSTDIVLNFSENFVRNDVPEYEKGRMINKLMKEYDMTLDEVAARLATTKKRIQLMLNIFNDTPKEFRKDVVYGVRGKSVDPGKVASSVANSINSICKRNNYSTQEKRKLYALAKQGKISVVQVRGFAKSLRDGESLSGALATVEKTKQVSVLLKLTKADYDYLYKMGSVTDVIRQVIYGEVKIKKLKRV